MLLYVPAGAAVDKILNQLSNALEPGDVIADGGNSYSGDSIRRSPRASTSSRITTSVTGEVSWLVADALRMEVPTPVIA